MFSPSLSHPAPLPEGSLGYQFVILHYSVRPAHKFTQMLAYIIRVFFKTKPHVLVIILMGTDGPASFLERVAWRGFTVIHRTSLLLTHVHILSVPC